MVENIPRDAEGDEGKGVSSEELSCVVSSMSSKKKKKGQMKILLVCDLKLQVCTRLKQ